MHPVRRIRRWLRKRKKVKKPNSFVEAALSEHIPNYNGIWAPLLSPLKGQEGHESLAKEMAEEKGVWRIPLDGKFWLLPEKQMKEVIKKTIVRRKSTTRTNSIVIRSHSCSLRTWRANTG